MKHTKSEIREGLQQKINSMNNWEQYWRRQRVFNRNRINRRKWRRYDSVKRNLYQRGLNNYSLGGYSKYAIRKPRYKSSFAEKWRQGVQPWLWDQGQPKPKPGTEYKRGWIDNILSTWAEIGFKAGTRGYGQRKPPKLCWKRGGRIGPCQRKTSTKKFNYKKRKEKFLNFILDDWLTNNHDLLPKKTLQGKKRRFTRSKSKLYSGSAK